MRENIFAYTGTTGVGYPPLVSINRLDDGDVEVTVRGGPIHMKTTDEVREGPQICVVVPAVEWERIKGSS